MNKITTPAPDFQTEPTLFEFEPVAGKKVTLDFSAPLLSSVGGLKARKKFNSNPLDELNEKQRRIYNGLPITFTTAEGLELAGDYNIPERTFKDWLKTNFFRHISHGQYEKRYK